MSTFKILILFQCHHEGFYLTNLIIKNASNFLSSLTWVIKTLSFYNLILLNHNILKPIKRLLAKLDKDIKFYYSLAYTGGLFFNGYLVSRHEHWQDLEIIVVWLY